MKSTQFSVRGRLKSFRFAGKGVLSFMQSEHNAWIHVIASVAVVALGIAIQIENIEWIAIIFSIGFVWVAEMINTSIEKLCDIVSPGYHPAIKLIKDIAAGAVLVAAIIAFVIGSIVFIPYLIK